MLHWNLLLNNIAMFQMHILMQSFWKPMHLKNDSTPLSPPPQPVNGHFPGEPAFEPWHGLCTLNALPTIDDAKEQKGNNKIFHQWMLLTL